MDEKQFNELLTKMESGVAGKFKELESALGEQIGEDVKAKLVDSKEFAAATDLSEIRGIVEEVQKNLDTLAQRGNVAAAEQQGLDAWIKENRDAIKATATGKDRTIKMPERIARNYTRKADLVRAGIATNTYALDIPGVGQLDRNNNTLYNFLSKVPVGPGQHNGTIRYLDWNNGTTVRAGANVAENTAIPESTATFSVLTLALEKVGDTLPVSEEFFEDETLAAAELGLFLERNVLDAVNAGLIAGDGVPPNFQSLTTRSTAYAPIVADAITAPNLSDLLLEMIQATLESSDAKYSPNFSLMPTNEIIGLRQSKTTDGDYVFNSPNERVPELQFLVDNNVTADTCFVGDSRYATIYEMPGIELSVGYTNDQFGVDMMTLKARKRLAMLIRNANQTGFRYCDSIAADLVTLAP